MSRALDDVSFAALSRADEQLKALQRTLRIARAPNSDPLQNYSPSRAIAWRAGKCSASDAKLEMFVHDEFRRAGHIPTADRSVLIPSQALMRHAMMQSRAQSYQTSVSGYGAELVEMTLRPDLFIDVLRQRSVTGQLGAQYIGGLQGDVQLPRETTASVGYWLSATGSPVQSGPITESEASFDSSPLQISPCMIGGFGRISRLLLQQSALADRVISNDLVQVLATALDQAAIQGAGTGGAPLGIVNQIGVNAISGASFSYATSVSALTALTTANAVVNRGALGWCATPTVAGVLSQRVKVASFPDYVWSGNADSGAINNHLALATNNVPASTAVFGDWSQLLILQWGDADAPIEVEVNAFGSGFSSGDVQIRAMLSANIALRHPPSFSVVTAIT